MSLVMPGDRLQARSVTFDGSGEQWAETGSGLVVPTYAVDPEPAPRPVAVDLFCGAGGFSLGFHQAGWHVAAAAEWDLHAMCTYLANLGGPDTRIVLLSDLPARKVLRGAGWEGYDGPARAGDTLTCAEAFPDAGAYWINGDHDIEPCEVFFYGDVTKLTGDMVLDALGRDHVDCVFGGPPCQGFSTANGKSVAEARHDGRNQLVFEFARLVLEMRARTFVMENVPRLLKMLTPEGVPVIDALARVMADGGFSTYDAMRSSLLANAGAGGAVRRERSQPDDEAPDPDEGDEDDVDTQQALDLGGGA